MSNIVRVERVDFQIAPGVLIDFYRFPDGEKRIGLTGAAIACGHRKEYFQRLHSGAPKQLEALQQAGFDGCTRDGMVERVSVGSKGSAKVKTLSQDDFLTFIKVSAFDLNKKPAQALAKALMGVALESLMRAAFNEESLSLTEIRSMICRSYAKTLDWLEEDRNDTAEIDEHLIFVRAN